MPGIPRAGGTGVSPGQRWAPSRGSSHWGGCLGPRAPPCEFPSPGWSKGVGPASLTYFGPAGDKGGLCSSAQAEEGREEGGARAQPALGPPGPPPAWPCPPSAPSSSGDPRGQGGQVARGSHRTPPLLQGTPGLGTGRKSLGLPQQNPTVLVWDNPVPPQAPRAVSEHPTAKHPGGPKTCRGLVQDIPQHPASPTQVPIPDPILFPSPTLTLSHSHPHR